MTEVRSISAAVQAWPRPPRPQVLEIGPHLFRAGWQRDLVDGRAYPFQTCPHGGACATLRGSPRRGLTDKVLNVDRIDGRLPIDDVAGALVPSIKVERRSDIVNRCESDASVAIDHHTSSSWSVRPRCR